MFFLFLSLFCALSIVLAKPAISLYECKPGDDACVTRAVQAAYPLVFKKNSDIGAEKLDPMFQKTILANMNTLKFKLYNSTVAGFEACQVEKVKYDNVEEQMQIHLVCPYFNFKGLYEVGGEVLKVPAHGNGDYVIKSKKYNLTVTLDLNTIEIDGKNYRQVKSFKVNAKPLEFVSYDLKNLFNGQKDFADAFLQLIKEHGKEVSFELQNPVFDGYIQNIVDNTNKYLKTLPIDEYTPM